MAKVTIDGKDIEVAAGSLILDAAQEHGISIPTFCYQERLTPLASCRMCLVEIEGQPKLAPACVTHVADGMVVKTGTSNVADTRESMLEMLLANHPLDCPVCDKAGECELQDMVFAYGAGESRFRDKKRVFRSEDISLNNVIVFNANRCIQCQRCVRMCEEVVGAVALGTMERGMSSEITGFEDTLKDCDHCGNCIEVCPVGALMSEPYRYNSRPWDLVKTDTSCTFCGTGCQLSIEMRDGKLARVKSKYETGINGETLCVKGRFGVDHIDSDNRIETPMVRKQGRLVPVSWDEALDALVQHVGSEPSARHVAGLASASLSCETLYLFQKMIRTVFQSNSVDSSNRWASCRQDTKHFSQILPQLLGDFYTKKPLETLLEADCILAVGSNVSDDNPVTDYLIRLSLRDNPNRLLMASARPSRLDSLAVGKMRLLPGQENLFFSSMEASLTGGTTGRNDHAFDNFATKAQSLIKDSKTVTLLVGSDLLRSRNAANALLWLQTYIVTLKSLGKQVALQFLFDRGNQMGAWELGVLPGYLPGWNSVEEMMDRTVFENAWRMPLPDKSGKNSREILESCARGDMDLLYCLHSDPLSFFPGRELAEKALSKVGKLVVQASHQSPTTELADIVFPGAAYAEEDGTVLNNEGRLQRLHKIRKPIADAKDNLDILRQVATRFGTDIGVSNPARVFSEIATLVPSFRDLAPNVAGEMMTPAQSKAKIEYEPSDLPPHVTPAADLDESGDFLLLTGESRFHFGGLSTHSKTLTGIEADGYVEMNSEDAANLNFQAGDKVCINRGDVKMQLPVKLNKDLAAKTLFIPENFVHLQLNRLWSGGDYPSTVKVEKETTH